MPKKKLMTSEELFKAINESDSRQDLEEMLAEQQSIALAASQAALEQSLYDGTPHGHSNPTKDTKAILEVETMDELVTLTDDLGISVHQRTEEPEELTEEQQIERAENIGKQIAAANTPEEVAAVMDAAGLRTYG